jgi:hypothetical protein
MTTKKQPNQNRDAFIGFTTLLLIIFLISKCNCGDDEKKPEASTTSTNTDEKDKASSFDFSNIHIPAYEVVRTEQAGSTTDLYACLTELPSDSLQLEATVRYISKQQLEKKDISDRIRVWLYLNKKQASNEQLKSEFIANYYKNFNTTGIVEGSNVSIDRLQYILNDTSMNDYESEVKKVKAYLSAKGIDYCDLHIQQEEWFINSVHEADKIYEKGSQQNMDHQEKLSKQYQSKYRKEHGISEDMWNNIYIYASYACM